MQEHYEEDIECVLPENCDRGAIYIGNVDAARNLMTLKKHNIKAVITMAKGAFLTHSQQDLPNYLYIPAEDIKSFDLSVYFEKTFEFIEKNKRRSNILVHCMAGVSRSVTIVIAYLMKKENKSMVEAYHEIRKKRPVIDPNEGFLAQLRRYEAHLKLHPFNNHHENKSHVKFAQEPLKSQYDYESKLQEHGNFERRIQPINLEEKLNILRQRYHTKTNLHTLKLPRNEKKLEKVSDHGNIDTKKDELSPQTGQKIRKRRYSANNYSVHN